MRQVLFYSFFVLSSNCFAQTNNYSFDAPNEIFHLPEVLHEISGLTDIDSNRIACVQDELGMIFIYDIALNKIVNRFEFSGTGDYEGVTWTGNSLYILRSDGMILECLLNEHSSTVKIDSFKTDIPANDNEGLCYDSKNNRLLIGCKSKLGKGLEFKNTRAIYGFDLISHKLSDIPAYELDVSKIIAFAEEKNIPLPTKFKKKTNEEITKIKLGISAIAIHPISNQLYVLSAIDHLLLIYGNSGEIEGIFSLNKELYQKAEGITFFGNSDMLISNEGQESQPTLLKLNYLSH